MECKYLPPDLSFLPPADMMAHKVLRSKLKSLDETNPMMGLRGCRLGMFVFLFSVWQCFYALSTALSSATSFSIC